MQPERSEDDLDIEEVLIAPPLPRRPDYHNGGHRYGSQRSRAWAPPPMPSVFYREEYEHAERRPHVLVQEAYDYDHRRGQNWRQHRAISPQLSDDSSRSSELDCEECAYGESRRRYGDHGRGRSMKSAPYIIVPRSNVGVRAPTSPVHADGAHSSAYIREAPRVYRLDDSVELENAIGGPPPTREPSPTDNASLIADSHNQIVLFQGTSGSGGSGGQVASDGMSIMHSNVSSPGWSVAGQRYLSGSETHSDAHSHSPMTSLDGLYEHPDPRFGHEARPPPRLHMQRPVVITRSDESYERFEDYGRYGDVGGSDGIYSSSERSFSSSSGEYYGGDYRRRYW